MKLILTTEQLEKAEKLQETEQAVSLQKELEDITDIAEYNIKPFYISFAANANRILVDYKKFKEHLLKELRTFSLKTPRDESKGHGKKQRNRSRSSS